jgi:hypothetical protein
MTAELEKSIFQRIVKAKNSGLDKMIIDTNDIKILADIVDILDTAEDECINENICPACWTELDDEEDLYCNNCSI